MYIQIGIDNNFLMNHTVDYCKTLGLKEEYTKLNLTLCSSVFNMKRR